MKTFTLTILLLLISISKAQDINLPQGKSNIYLRSGKTFRNVSVWRIDSTMVEYVLNGNLADLKTTDVSKIETPDFRLRFDDENRIIKSDYGVIELNSGEAIRGMIRSKEGQTIPYTTVGSNKVKTVLQSKVDSYWEVNGSKPNPTDSSTTTKNDSIQIVHEPVVKTDWPLKKDSVTTKANVVLFPKEAVNEKIMDKNYYHLSYEVGAKNAVRDYQMRGGRVSNASINLRVETQQIPSGVDGKLYKEGYKNELIKKQAKKAATGVAVAKVIFAIILIGSL